MRILVTGGAGFIGSALIRKLVSDSSHSVLNIDKLTYAGNLDSLKAIEDSPRYHFLKLDICKLPELNKAFNTFKPDAVFHLAAESHVDRSIDNPAVFLETNVLGTYNVLQASLNYLHKNHKNADDFRVLHISTDEVYGSLGKEGHFSETSLYQPNSPYAASKAASDHLARSWFHTFQLPVLISNCSNNYGPYQFPEKFIPTMILNAIQGKALPVYGKGDNVRDWLHVEDHVEALLKILDKGNPGESYNIGGFGEHSNLEVVHMICDLVDAHEKRTGDKSTRSQITYVKDRPGHDFRYAIDSSKAQRELDWFPKRRSFYDGLQETFTWYLEHHNWWKPILAERYGGERLGLNIASRRKTENSISSTN